MKPRSTTKKKKRRLLERLINGPLAPQVSYTLDQIRNFVKNRAYVLRVYDKPKKHRVLERERNDPTKTQQQLIAHWLELSDVELKILKPQFIGLPVINEHMGNDPTVPGYRPMLCGALRRTSGVVVGVEQLEDGTTDVIIRCFPNFDGEWLCNHLETCFQGASIQHTRSAGTYDDMTLREVSIVLLGRHENTVKTRVIELTNPEPLQYFSAPYEHAPSFDFKKLEEFARGDPKVNSLIDWSSLKNQAPPLNLSHLGKLVSLSSVIGNYSFVEDSKTNHHVHNERVEQFKQFEQSMSTSSQIDVNAGATPVVAPTPALSGNVASNSTIPNSISAIGGALGMTAPPTGAVGAVGGAAASPVGTVAAADATAAMDTSADGSLANLTGGAAGARGVKRGHDEIGSSSSSSSNEDGSAAKRARDPLTGNSPQELIADLDNFIVNNKSLLEQNPDVMGQLLDKMAQFKSHLVQTASERDALKADSTFYQGQMEYMHSKFMDDLQNLVRFVMANYSDPDQESFEQAKTLNPRTSNVNDIIKTLGPLIGRASAGIDTYNAINMKKVLSDKTKQLGGGSATTATTATTATVSQTGSTPAPSSSPLTGTASAVSQTTATPQVARTQANPTPTPTPTTAVAPTPATASVPVGTALVSTASAGAHVGTQQHKTPKNGADLHKTLDKFLNFQNQMTSTLHSTRANTAGSHHIPYRPPERPYYNTLGQSSQHVEPALTSGMVDPSAGNGAHIPPTTPVTAQPLTSLASAVPSLSNYGSVGGSGSGSGSASSSVPTSGGGLRAIYNQVRAERNSYSGSGSGSGSSGQKSGSSTGLSQMLNYNKMM